MDWPEAALPEDFEDGLLTRTEAADYLTGLGVRRTVATLAKLYATSDAGPPLRHLGRRVFYAKRDLHDWAMRQLVLPRRGSRERSAFDALTDEHETRTD